VDEAFKITPEFVVLPPREGGAPGETKPEEAGAEGKEIPARPAAGPGPGPGPAPVEVFTEDDCMFMSEALWSLPGIILDKIPEPDPVKLRKWNAVFFKYCLKKGINPYDLLFDELPLIIATAGIAAPMWKAYKASAPLKEPAKPVQGAEDYEHEKKLAEDKVRDLAEGRIGVSPSMAVTAAGPEASGTDPGVPV
jgi:hypothetical protein